MIQVQGRSFVIYAFLCRAFFNEEMFMCKGQEQWVVVWVFLFFSVLDYDGLFISMELVCVFFCL